MIISDASDAGSSMRGKRWGLTNGRRWDFSSLKGLSTMKDWTIGKMGCAPSKRSMKHLRWLLASRCLQISRL